jgi:hypothetical protein
MTEPKPQNQSPMKNLIWLWPVLVAALGLAGFALFLANAATPVPASWGTDGGARNTAAQWLSILIESLISPVIICLLGTLIINRRPGHRIGRLLIALSVLVALNTFILEWVVYGHFTSAERVPGTAVVAWVGNWLWVTLLSLLILIVSLFPDGRYPTRIGGWLLSGTLFLFAVPMLAMAMVGTPLESVFQIDNPFVADQPQAFYDFMFSLGIAALPVAVLAALLSAVTRFRRGQGRERQQMKWLLAGAALMALMILAGLVIVFGLDNAYGGLLINAALLGPMLGVGIALLRHQLYDIDVIIRRTLQYTLLTSLLALVYFGSVVLLQTLFGLAAGEQSPLIIVISTLVIAALFTPLRRRAQAFTDRRFYRQKYDAEQILARFGQTARDETDLAALQRELLHVVQETMQPEMVSVWLKPRKDSIRNDARNV